MKIIIHTCDRRLWYVCEFLVPALRAQGIEPEIHNDNEHRGNLWAYIDSFRSLSAGTQGTWHLEDDVFPCRDFARIAKLYDDGIVHGFFHRFGKEQFEPGWVPVEKAGYSFPCFRMPDRLAVEFAEWFVSDAQCREENRRWVVEGRHIDSFMLNFLRERHPGERVFNLKPSIVEHIDDLIGGSVINQNRGEKCRAEYFGDNESIEELRVKLASR